MDQFWSDCYIASADEFTCPACNKGMKQKTSNTPKNPGRAFVSCNDRYGGCGFFCWTDQKPRGGAQRRTQQVTVNTGAVATMPDEQVKMLVDLQTQVQEILDIIKQVYADSPPQERKRAKK